MAINIPLLLILVLEALKMGYSETVTLSTPLGKIAGVKRSITNSTDQVYIFKSIPYAKPPVGNLRFEKPVPYGGWNGTLNASMASKICIQNVYPKVYPLESMSEDCLFLNIYVPNSLSSTNNKSVMVWIHGGGYYFGSANTYDGSSLSVHGDVIVVTVNYRLGIFGFMNLDNGRTRGNYGLWDQMLALKWVNKYIRYFGGNPSSVTIFGESAGGWSVGLLSLIPTNKGLFQRVIAESGVGNSPLALNKSNAELAIIIGLEVSCSDQSTLLSCMRQKDPQMLHKAYSSVVKRPDSSISFRLPLSPVIDQELFMETPHKILSGPRTAALEFFRSLDMIVGNCDAEGSIAENTVKARESQFNFSISAGIPSRILKTNIIPRLIKDFFSDNQQVQKAICDEYCVTDSLTEQGRKVVDMYGDLFFIAPAVYNLYIHSMNNTQSSTYQYIFSKEVKSLLPKSNTWFKGSAHASELAYLFDTNIPRFQIPLPSGEHDLPKEMKTYWTNFAKYGNPNGGSNMAAWPEYDSKNRYFLRLDDVTRAEIDYLNDRVEFWLKDIPNILKNNIGSPSVELSLLFSSIFGR